MPTKSPGKPKMRRVTCDQCQLLRINGVICHEIGCPNAWRDYTLECAVCGGDFRPKHRYQRSCHECQREMS